MSHERQQFICLQHNPERIFEKKFFGGALSVIKEIVEFLNNVLVEAISIKTKSRNTYLKVCLNRLIIKVCKTYVKNVTKTYKKDVF